MSSPSPLRSLSDTIAQATAVIDGAFEAAKLPFPSLDTPFDPQSPAEALFAQPEVARAAETLVLAGKALSACTVKPQLLALRTPLAHTISAALNVALEGYVPEILHGRPEGVPVNEIATVNGLESGKLGRILRRLASIHIFTEVKPNVFAHNRLSSVYDTGKSVEDILKKFYFIYDHRTSITHYVILVQSSGTRAPLESAPSRLTSITDEIFKSAAHLHDALKDKEYGFSDKIDKTAFSYVFKTGNIWEWFEQPGNERRLATFTAAMKGGSISAQNPDNILKTLDWASLPQGAKVVDVGGGMGHVVIPIAKRYPQLQFVVEDRQAVVEKAKEHWKQHLPAASVEMVPQDFFATQAVKQPAVFTLFHIIHDWGRTASITILRRLREAAGPDTKLIIGDQIAPYACPVDVQPVPKDIKGADKLSPPILPLLAPGRAEMACVVDMSMMICLNAEERTLSGFVELASASGWKIVEVCTNVGSFDAHMVAVPV
ncbi:S-adenosyl-L-methionine-dependent methyltransferase [Schizophyllum commune H4-8]|nr:S-adenosyl-L-methionine-dependent methyltransferase [Schizophyllum commune H4-8]KAI5888463.1 S-adenosyl-L-methionine-dependent methyltransferase [Schizophyllum commune H4-8]